MKLKSRLKNIRCWIKLKSRFLFVILELKKTFGKLRKSKGFNKRPKGEQAPEDAV